MSKKIIIVGAGLVGSLEAVFLAKRGYQVEVYERRSDIRAANIVGGRSINLALSNRGWRALELAGIKEQIEKISIPMHSRLMHDLEGNLTYQPYGKEGEAIYSVSRGELNRQLLLLAATYDNVNFHFDEKCIDIDLEHPKAYFENAKTGKTSEVSADLIIGTDGAFSAVRAKLQRTDRFDYSQMYLPHGYKELTIPAVNDLHAIEKNVLHIWPRGNYMLIALPNIDGSFTCTLFFPFEGKPSFESLSNDNEILNFFESIFKDAKEKMPDLLNDYHQNPTASLVTVRCAPWNFKNKVLVIGDASHAIVPFYGQGMNSGFEDCYVLEKFLDKYKGDWDTVLPTYANYRKPDADAISELALRNFIEMRDSVADDNFLLQKKIEKKIFEKHPEKWMPLYSMVTFSDYRYSEALNLGKKQDAIMQKIMAKPNIHEIWNSDEIEKEILASISN